MFLYMLLCVDCNNFGHDAMKATAIGHIVIWNSHTVFVFFVLFWQHIEYGSLNNS